jgi:hypothetical protein
MTTPPSSSQQNSKNVAGGDVAAIAGALVVLAGLIGFGYERQILDVTTYLTPAVTAGTILLAYLCTNILSRRGWRPIYITSTTVLITGALAVLALGAIWFYQTNPGRRADHDTAAWKVVYNSNFAKDSGCRVIPADKYGSGNICTNDGVLAVDLSSNVSAVQSAITNAPRVSGNWYAATSVRLAQGPADATCLLYFGYTDENHWYVLRVQGQQPGSQGGSAGVSQYEGSYPGRVFISLTINRSINLASWTNLAIEAKGNLYSFFVNDRLVNTIEIFGVRGGINLGTLAPASTSRTNEVCEFNRLVVRQQ